MSAQYLLEMMSGYFRAQRVDLSRDDSLKIWDDNLRLSDECSVASLWHYEEVGCCKKTVWAKIWPRRQVLGDCLNANFTFPTFNTSDPKHPFNRDLDTYLGDYAEAGWRMFRWSSGNCAFSVISEYGFDGFPGNVNGNQQQQTTTARAQTDTRQPRIATATATTIATAGA